MYSAPTSRWLSPVFLGRLAVGFGVVFFVAGLVMTLVFPSPTASDTISRILTAAFGAILIAAIGGLTLAIAENTMVVREHVLPLTRR